jgi:hypothetical protein
MDNDATMLEQMGTALTNLQIKYRASSLADRMELRPALDKLLQKYTDYQARLLDEGIITKDADLVEMEEIKKAIDGAAQKQQLAAAIAKTAAFIATKMAVI